MQYKNFINSAILAGVLAVYSIFGTGCGSDVQEPDPQQDAEVQTDAGVQDRGTIDDVLNSDVPVQSDANGDNIVPDTGHDANDTGIEDACYGCDVNSTDTFDGGVDTGNITDTYDAGVDTVDDTGIQDTGDAGVNQAPVAMLKYALSPDPNWPQWVVINEGDTLTKPVNKDITFNTCDSYDPDGSINKSWVKYWEGPGNGTPVLYCDDTSDANHKLQDKTPSYLLVEDNKGAQSKLNFFYESK